MIRFDSAVLLDVAFYTLPTSEEIERQYMVAVLNAHEQNRTHAARVLGIGRATLYRKMKKWGLK